MKKSNQNNCFEDYQYVIFTSKYTIQNNQLLVKDGPNNIFIEDFEEPIIDFENYFPDDPDYSIENAIALTYINYLRSKEIPVTENTKEIIRITIKKSLLDCKKLAKKDIPSQRDNLFFFENTSQDLNVAAPTNLFDK